VPSAPLDRYQRRIDYLRLSITDRCNLRCIYCMPDNGVPKLAHADILRYEEMLRVARLAVSMGISKVRITGGEPLVRRDAVAFCGSIARLPGIHGVSVTTNGLLLPRYAGALFQAGVRRINISLDTLDPQRFARITRCDAFAEVWRGVESCREAGFHPIKLNAVVMRGVNDADIEPLALVTTRYPYHVRFIECMPFQAPSEAEPPGLVAAAEILDRLRQLGTLTPVDSVDGNGPARHYQLAGAPGTIGIISPISHHFCPSCNRLRLTADGRLRACLFAAEEIDLQRPLRTGASDEDIRALIRKAVHDKPKGHSLGPAPARQCFTRPMAAIGG
jgi:cyclic pyranopterin phosphate synthase